MESPARHCRQAPDRSIHGATFLAEHADHPPDEIGLRCRVEVRERLSNDLGYMNGEPSWKLRVVQASIVGNQVIRETGYRAL